MTTAKVATTAEVRAFYKDAGHVVRINRAGNVRFKRNGQGPWLEGRWVDEYRVDPQHGVYLP